MMSLPARSLPLRSGIGFKIILPYVLLTLAVAGIGAYVVTNLIAGSLQERFNNQLLDAGRIVSETLIDYENERLAVLRYTIRTEGVPQGVASDDHDALSSLVPQIILNSDADSLILLNKQGDVLYGWQHDLGTENGEFDIQTDFMEFAEIQLALSGTQDEFGDKRSLLMETPSGYYLYAVGPVYINGEPVGVALVGTDVKEMIAGLTENAVAKVTLYDQTGTVIGTSLGAAETVAESLQESPEHVQSVTEFAETEVPVRHLRLFGQDYQLALGEWQLRGQPLGLFSVALPSNFIVTTAVTSRNLLSLIFALATMTMFLLGLFTARRIVEPINRLAQISTAVSEGDLDQRTGIIRSDEIGVLAHSFDTMTQNLLERNQQLVEKASELETILHSITDGIIVLDMGNQIVAANPAAEALLQQDNKPENAKDMLSLADLIQLSPEQGTRRYEIGSRFFSALVVPARTAAGMDIGRVIVLRDVTREAEAEQLRDGFVTSISHELRTPLTSIKGYTELLLTAKNENLDASQKLFLEKARNNTNQLITHVNKLIEISEMQSGTLQLRLTEINFAEIAGTTALTWTERMEKKGLSLTITRPDEPIRLLGDEKRLIWAIDNLLSNAFLYTMTGGTVHIDIYCKDDEACFVVQDTGIGISVADQPYLFSQFFRAHDEQIFDAGGVGLGLYITKHIIEAHNGRVWLESTLGEGSLFGFALPLQPGNLE